MFSQFLGTAATVYGVLGALKSLLQAALIVVDTAGLLCAGLTLAVALSLPGSLIRPATWNSRNTTSTSQGPLPHTHAANRPESSPA